ncbi:MAG: hypothetical protein KC912_08900 [Proteobacteria bacterium]|nr:hypothetical protein [Pseudomonadota bacterium]
MSRLRSVLEPLGWGVRAARSVDQAVGDLDESVTVLACHAEDRHGLSSPQRLAVGGAHVPVVLYSELGGVDDVLCGFRFGAFDVVAMGADDWLETMVSAVERGHQRTAGERRRCAEARETERRAMIGIARQSLELRRARRQHQGTVVRLQTTSEELHEELRAHRQLETVLHDQRDALQRAQLATGHLLRDLGDEIQEPLGSILSSVEELIDRRADDFVCKQALGICAEVRRLSATIEDVFELARLQDGTAQVQTRAIDLLPFVLDLLEEVHDEVDESELDISLHVEASVAAAWVDPDRLRTAMLHLILGVVRLRTQRILQIKLDAEPDQVVMSLYPVDTSPGTWRAAELLRCLGGSLTEHSGRLELRMLAAELPATPPGAVFEPVEQLTPQVLLRVRRAMRTAEERRRKAAQKAEMAKAVSAGAAVHQSSQSAYIGV